MTDVECRFCKIGGYVLSVAFGIATVLSVHVLLSSSTVTVYSVISGSTVAVMYSQWAKLLYSLCMGMIVWMDLTYYVTSRGYFPGIKWIGRKMYENSPKE